MKGIYAGVRAFLCVSVISSALTYLAPGKKSEKYLRTVASFICVAMLVAPLLRLFGVLSDLRFDEKAYAVFADSGTAAAKNAFEELCAEYIIRDVKKVLEERYGIVADVSVETGGTLPFAVELKTVTVKPLDGISAAAAQRAERGLSETLRCEVRILP